VCTDANGVAITNTATLTPAGGTAITKVATANIVIFGCDVPPTLNFQELQSWGAQTFSWALQSRATRCAWRPGAPQRLGLGVGWVWARNQSLAVADVGRLGGG
jgi:hypothetical protein